MGKSIVLAAVLCVLIAFGVQGQSQICKAVRLCTGAYVNELNDCSDTPIQESNKTNVTFADGYEAIFFISATPVQTWFCGYGELTLLYNNVAVLDTCLAYLPPNEWSPHSYAWQGYAYSSCASLTRNLFNITCLVE